VTATAIRGQRNACATDRRLAPGQVKVSGGEATVRLGNQRLI
jgi:hypothetical protein